MGMDLGAAKRAVRSEILMRKAPSLVLVLIAVLFGLPSGITAQTTPGPDVLILTGGERLTGHFQGATGGKVDFNSDALGKIYVDWSKVQELRPTQRFAVIRKGAKITKNLNVGAVPQGTIAIAGQMITVTPGNGGAPQT